MVHPSTQPIHIPVTPHQPNRLMESEETVRVLAREMALMALDRYGQPTIDIPLQVYTSRV